MSFLLNTLPEYYVRTIFSLFLSVCLGGIIGLERGRQNRPAGARTHMIVCVGSCLMMLLGIQLQKIYPDIDVTRIGAQVVSGIGFLGAGAILKEGFSVRGLTTASTLWVVACVGLAAGGGYYFGAILATILIYVALQWMGNYSVVSTKKQIGVFVSRIDDVLPSLLTILTNYNIKVSNVSIFDCDNDMKELKFDVIMSKKIEQENLVKDLVNIKGALSAHIE